MNLFDITPNEFKVGDIVQLKAGYDMEDLYSRCRVCENETGSLALIPWLIEGKEEIAAAIHWLTFKDAADKYCMWRKNDGFA